MLKPTVLYGVGALLLILVILLVVLRSINGSDVSSKIGGGTPDEGRMSEVERAENRDAPLSPKSAARTAPANRDESRPWEVNREGNLGDRESRGFVLLDGSGKVTARAIEMAGLETDDIDAVESALADAWKKMSAAMASRARFDATSSDAENRVFVYRVASFPSEGDAALEAMYQNFADTFGADSAAILMRGFDPWQHFGNFGKYEIEVRYEPNTFRPQIYGETNTRIRFFDPATGKEAGGASSLESETIANYIGQFTDLVKDR
ncbi:hypothetical protein [Haloferula helveola]